MISDSFSEACKGGNVSERKYIQGRKINERSYKGGNSGKRQANKGRNSVSRHATRKIIQSSDMHSRRRPSVSRHAFTCAWRQEMVFFSSKSVVPKYMHTILQG